MAPVLPYPATGALAPGTSELVTPPQSPRTRSASPPTTPRVAPKFASSTSPPATPRPSFGPKLLVDDCCSPPPAPQRAAASPLLRAMLANSAAQARAALHADPLAAFEPLFDYGVEPPLCAAARLGVRPEIVSLLLDHGADPTSVDAEGRQPLQVLTKRAQNVPLTTAELPTNQAASLAEVRARQNEWEARSRRYEEEVAAMLLAKGATAHSTQLRGGAGTSSLRIAQRMGKGHLVRLYRGNTGPVAAM